MKTFILLAVNLAIYSICSADVLYSNSTIGVEIEKSDELVSIGSKAFDRGAEAIRFYHDHNRFFVTAFLHRPKAKMADALTKKIAEIGVDQHRKNYPDLKLINESKVQTKFKEITIMGYSIHAEYTGSKMKLCDISEVYPIKNYYYMTVVLTTAADVCMESPDELRKSLNTLYKSMSFSSI